MTTRDPLGNDTTMAYDRPYHLLPVQVTDAVGLTTSAEHDYRVLQPRMVTDANGNRRAVSFSPLGLVTATAVMGKEGEQAGDTLEAPGSRLEYDFFAFVNRQQPVFVRSIVREHHVTETDVPLPERDETIETVEYSDGFGRLLQTRTQAEDVLFGDPHFGGGVLSADQSSATGDAVGRRRAAGDPPNVIVSGWQVYDNKGRVVEKYEPFFAYRLRLRAARRRAARAEGHDVLRPARPGDPHAQSRWLGAAGDLWGPGGSRPIPSEFAPTPWEAYTYDANDLAPLSHGRRTAHRSPTAAPATHHFTPSSIVIDALGRTVEAVARNGRRDPADCVPDRASTYDIRGNVLTVTDALDRVAFRYTYDLANRPWRIDSIDAGLRRMVLNVLGNEIERRDSKGALILQAYDRLQRPIRLWARDDAGSPITLRQRMEYGDARNSGPARAGARGDASQKSAGPAPSPPRRSRAHHGGGGRLQGQCARQIPPRHRRRADPRRLRPGAANGWQVTPFQVDWEPRPQQTLADREGELLETTAYRTTASYDALNRVKRMQFPQDVEGQRRELRPDLQPRRRARTGLAGRHALRRAHRLRRQGPARADRLRQRRDDPLCLRPAHVPSEAPAQRALHQTGRPQLPPDRRGAAGLRLRLRPGREHPRASATATPGSGILNNPEASTAADPALAQLLVSGNALNRRFDYDPIYRLLSATGRECDRPPDGAAVGRPAALHRSHARPRLHRALSLRRDGQHAAPGAPQRRRRLHPRVHRGAGQQPPAPHEDRR